jgi:hypothetical protein
MVNSDVLARGPFRFTVFQISVLFVTSNNFFAISSAILLPSLMLRCKVCSLVHKTTVCCTQVWYNCIMLIIVVELRTSGGFWRWGFCISFIHNIQEVSLGFVVLCNIFFHHRSSKMANELRIFSSCKRIISSQHQIKEWWEEWWICNHLGESSHGSVWVLSRNFPAICEIDNWWEAWNPVQKSPQKF